MDQHLENTCVYCDEMFNLSDKSPYLLPCGQHTACKLCLSEARNSGEEELECPIDKKVLRLSELKTLSKNMEIVAILKRQKQGEVPKQQDKLKESKWLEASLLQSEGGGDESSMMVNPFSKDKE